MTAFFNDTDPAALAARVAELEGALRAVLDAETNLNIAVAGGPETDLNFDQLPDALDMYKEAKAKACAAIATLTAEGWEKVPEGMCVVPRSSLSEYISDAVYGQINAGIINTDRWMDGGLSDAEGIREEMGLGDGWHPLTLVHARAKVVIEARIIAMIEAATASHPVAASAHSPACPSGSAPPSTEKDT